MMKNKNLKCFITYEHVLGAKLAQVYLQSKDINAQMDELPEEGNAGLWIEEDKVEEARNLLEEWKREIQKRFTLI